MSNSQIRKLTAIMFTDIKGYTALVQHDETDALAKIDKYRTVLEEKTALHGGKVIEFYGDGALCVFDSIIECIQCGIEMQSDYRKGSLVPVRMGMHIGDIVFKDDTVYGDGVNLASRIEAQGVEGSILISEKVNKELFNHQHIKTESIGHYKLKNVTDPVHIFAIDHPDLVFPKTQFKKARQQKRVKIFTYVGIVLAALGGIIFSILQMGNKQMPTIEDLISVEEFNNLTPYDSLDFIGNIAGHYITQGISELSDSKVLAFQSKKEIETLQASLGNNRLTGRNAADIIKGYFQIVGQKNDSLLIKAELIEANTNLQKFNFEDCLGPVSNPMIAIKKMQDEIKGYWATKDDHLTAPPNYEAYKAYISARDNWDEDDELVELKLTQSIKLDPSFLDSYFLLISLYQNKGDFQSSREALNSLRVRFDELTNRQKAKFDYFDNVQNGNNKQAFLSYEKEYVHNKKDLFINTSMAFIALEAVNAPEKAIEYLKEIPIDSLELNNCNYCQERLYAEVLTNIKLDSLARAKVLIDKLPSSTNSLRYLGAKIRVAVLQKDISRVNEIIKQAPDIFAQLNFYAAREFLLVGEQTQTNIFADAAITKYGTAPNRGLAALYLFKKMPIEADSTYNKLAPEEKENIYALSYLGIAQAMMGENEKAIETIEKMKKKDSSFGEVEYYQAQIYAQLEEVQKALDKIKISIDAGAKFSAFERFETDPFLLPLKDNPEYQRLIHPLKN